MKGLKTSVFLVALSSLLIANISFAYKGEQYYPETYTPLPDDLVIRFAMTRIQHMWGSKYNFELDMYKFLLIPVYDLEGDRILCVVSYYSDLDKAPTFEDELERVKPLYDEIHRLGEERNMIMAREDLSDEEKNEMISPLNYSRSQLREEIGVYDVFTMMVPGSYEQQPGMQTWSHSLSFFITEYCRVYILLEYQFPSSEIELCRCLFVQGYGYSYEFKVDGESYVAAACFPRVIIGRADEVPPHMSTFIKKLTPDRYPYSPNPWEIYEEGNVFGDIEDITYDNVRDFWLEYGAFKDESDKYDFTGGGK